MSKELLLQAYFARALDLKKKFRRRERLTGVFVKSHDPAVLEIVAQCGADFLIADMEHRACSPENLETLVTAARLYFAPLLARVDARAPTAIAQALDAGALGIVAPNVGGAEEVAAIVNQMRYVGGARGFSPSVAANGYGALPAGEYKAIADDSLLLLTQIESWRGVQNAESIARSEGNDGVFVGPVDLAHSLENEGDNAPSLDEAATQIIAACQRAGLAAGVFDGAQAPSPLASKTGVSFVVAGTDFSILRDGCTERFQRFQSAPMIH